MSHEIYYTSAPEGIKRGSRGFCTVAATDAIPRVLWERLESLSGYRHHFEAGTRPGENPVTHAHWLVNVAGKEYHVLSRVCDAGMDYTQRTNAFAHHLALEAAELGGAGPAWFLMQPGVMVERWNGQVGPITRSMPLPHGGSGNGPRMCGAWARVAGDAGWAGVLAETFTKSPWKPVCILFHPGQDLLPLMDEAIALLPPAARWNATFSTYFTSIPTSATCAWRCCLVGTPAADAALRASRAGGLVLNLADPSKMSPLPESPWVDMARTGRPMPKWDAAAPTPPTAKSTPPAKAPPPLIPPIAAEPRPTLSPPRTPLRTPLETADPPAPEPYHEEDKIAIDRGTWERPDSPKQRLTEGLITVPPPERGRTTSRRPNAATPLPWKWIAGGATLLLCGVIAYLIVTWLNSVGAPPDEFPAPPPRPTVITPNPPPPTSLPANPAVVTTAPVIPTPATEPENPVVTTAPTPTPIIVPALPRLITLQAPLDPPPTGAPKPQTIPLQPKDFDNFKSINTLALQFPGEQKDYPYKQGDLTGAIYAESDSRPDRPALTIKWKDSLDPSANAEVLSITLNKAKEQLDLKWSTKAALSQPQVARLVYWVLRNSTLETRGSTQAKPDRVLFKPADLPTINLADADTPLRFPCDLPTLATAKLHDDKALPPGWQATAYIAVPDKEPPKPNGENVPRVIAFKKTTTIKAVDAAFELTFSGDWTTVQSNYAAHRQAQDAESLKYLEELSSPTLDPAKKTELDQLRKGCMEAMANYREVAGFDVALYLADGLKVAALHVHRDP